MTSTDERLYDLLLANPHLEAAWLEQTNPTPTLHLQTTNESDYQTLSLPHWTKDLKIQYHALEPFRILTTQLIETNPQNPHQVCQNEPIDLGTQIQPKNKPWVGTAGAPIIFKTPDQTWTTGILTNHHVVTNATQPPKTTLHQPTHQYPPIATNTLHFAPQPIEPNHLDAALCDARIHGKHTISLKILGIGKIKNPPTRLQPGQSVIKAGRTTAVTTGTCRATGVAAKVAYDNQTLYFVDQDLIEATTQQFSAPGDSGSLILTHPHLEPTALLFAGNSQYTLANPLTYLLAKTKARFPIQ